VRPPRLVILMLALSAGLLVACDDGRQASPTATPQPIPSPVAIRDEPQGVGLEDPDFEALPGATAYFGRLGGTVFRIEMPDEWNGRLVLYMHGFQGLAQQASVEEPSLRYFLIRHGYAWGASSYSSTALIPGRAADETAALWDEFVRRFGRPQRSYVTGFSMGGAATHIAAERYADRFDGALGMCGFAGQPAITQIIGDFFYTGAFVAGVTQQEFDANDVYTLIETRVKPALRDPARHEQWKRMLIDMTGGPRALVDEGFAMEEETNWERAPILIGFGLAYNQGREYAFGPGAGVSSAAFNAGVVRKPPAAPEQLANFNEGNLVTGDLRMPMLTIHTTGDWQVPIDQQHTLRRAVESAGKGDLLVQRAIRAPEHCGFMESEWARGLEDLRAWVERGVRPDGEDLTGGDLRDAGRKFTLSPRFGSDEAAAVPGAGERLTIRGALTRDGQPLRAFVWVDVLDGDHAQVCSFPGTPADDGRYERVIAADAEYRGCGAPGRKVRIAGWDDGLLYATSLLDWPEGGGTVTFDAALSPSAGSGGGLYGNITMASGDLVDSNTLIEAYAGDVLCGRTSTPPVVIQFSSRDFYDLELNHAIAGCEGGEYTVRADGETIGDVAVGAESVRFDVVMED
jgi:pimeloyl-ACP methyl ester carboxylesterase